MNDRVWSFFSVSVMLRPAQNTSHRSSGPPRRTGVSTVIAVAFPSTFATCEPYPPARRPTADASYSRTMAVASSSSRRDELRAFLRSRRARLSPADVGLPDNGGRRRTPGLRREELAALAGGGVSGYTWLEQGRDINPSPEVLDALARALRLDPAERRTLFALARTELPLADDVAGTDPDQLDDDIGQLIALVDSMHPNPAYLLGPLTRILAWNRAASVVLGSPDHLAQGRRYLLGWLMVEPG